MIALSQSNTSARLPCDRLSCRQADILLRGYSGYNIAWAQHLVPALFPMDAAVKPSLVTVFFGANDAALAGGVR
jgi:lysophospholipase L1-like esterase